MRHRYGVALAACVVVVLATAWVVVRGSPGSGALPSSDAVRLGPQAGQPVAEYLAGLPGRLPASGASPVPALVQFDAGLDVPAAAGLLAGTRPATAVLRVSLPRVQTALRFQPLAPVDDPDPVAAARRGLGLARAEAARDAAADAARLTGRSARVAASEAAALDRPGCRCVLAVLVVGDRAGLDALRARPGVRAVDAAPDATGVSGTALAPLLPEQTGVAGPVPDDGPLPPP